ncbi:MAG TPA: hypothetical protein VF669_08990 [Tepidisphaeraceae bacterium]|jgi:hypothetical protein
MIRVLLALLSLFCIANFQTAFAATTSPATLPANQLAALVTDLGNLDSAVRERARTRLLAIGADELTALRNVVAKNPSLNKSQVIALREIVNHVFLATQNYPQLQQMGFLGVTLAPIKVSTLEQHDELEGADPLDQLIEANKEERATTAVVVQERMPGFCGFGAFQTGDIIVAIQDDPPIRIESVGRLQLSIRARAAGERITFQILRQGKKIDITLTLSGYPDALLPGVDPTDFRREREEAATNFWNQTFAPLLGQRVS